MATASGTSRRSAADWHALVHQQRDSGLSAAAFCRRHDLVYQTFVGRRRQLGVDAPGVRVASAAADTLPAMPALPGFVEIGVAEPDAQGAPDAGDWLVELDLGDGMQLRVRRPR